MTRARQVANFDPALFAADEISGDKVSGGTIGAGTLGGTSVINTSGAITTTGAFTSVGIDDNADATAITIDSSERVGINTASGSATSLLTITQNADTSAIDIYGYDDMSAKKGSLSVNDVGYTQLRSHSDRGMDFKSGETSASQFRWFADDTQKMTLDASGNLLLGKTAVGAAEGLQFEGGGLVYAICSNARPGIFARNDSDGTLIQFDQAGSNEGSISVSGSTVSYNGGHLARWSHLADGKKDTSILKGTVLTNLNDMCHWEVEDEDGNVNVKDNDQLNQVAVSSVEGDPNVAGVMVNWCDCDEGQFPNTIDLNVAMTGDMIIRIAKDVTVERGDLLMSAGDGTAKPQDDDIVRSKTIAKVISNNVSCTYDDESYCVPCVLMAC